MIRLLMAQAASNADVDLRNLSFKHTVQVWTHRAANAKKKSQTPPLAQDAQGSRSKAGSTTRACLGHEVSAIRA
jgi:hypothetical protein